MKLHVYLGVDYLDVSSVRRVFGDTVGSRFWSAATQQTGRLHGRSRSTRV